MSDISNAEPDANPPAFYAMWEDTTGLPSFTDFGSVALIVPQHRMMIYGRACSSSFEDDIERIESASARGWVYGEWFSELCPDGELGSNHIERLTEITRAQFDAARAAEWPNEVPLTCPECGATLELGHDCLAGAPRP